jgi:hypothetical protein
VRANERRGTIHNAAMRRCRAGARGRPCRQSLAKNAIRAVFRLMRRLAAVASSLAARASPSWFIRVIALPWERASRCASGRRFALGEFDLNQTSQAPGCVNGRMDRPQGRD